VRTVLDSTVRIAWHRSPAHKDHSDSAGTRRSAGDTVVERRHSLHSVRMREFARAVVVDKDKSCWLQSVRGTTVLAYGRHRTPFKEVSRHKLLTVADECLRYCHSSLLSSALNGIVQAPNPKVLPPVFNANLQSNKRPLDRNKKCNDKTYLNLGDEITFAVKGCL
jgi:hypothetical protein